MSVLHTSSSGCLISHQDFLNTIYKDVEDANGVKHSYIVAWDIFNITHPFKTSTKNHNLKRKLNPENIIQHSHNELQQMIDHVQNLYRTLRPEMKHLFSSTTPIHGDETCRNNLAALKISQKIYEESSNALIRDAIGGNNEKANFFCKDVIDIERYLINIKYNLIVLDPPWWNKYIRRKKAKTGHGYEMMYNESLQDLPIDNLLDVNGLVVVWCTNSLQHLQTLQNTIFSKWNIKFVGKWYWLKVTRAGEPVCAFSDPPGKQPFEQIVIGSANLQRHILPDDGKLVVSIPSALHSHKPPLIELLKPYLPENPKCLEIFARYLLPNWTSFGLEATRFQHECLYEPNL